MCSHLQHALLVEAAAVAEEAEQLQEDKEGGSDEGLAGSVYEDGDLGGEGRLCYLVPRVQQGRGSAFEHTVSNELTIK